ncbi:hypothetical protein ACOSP7_026793 [Xanthoceras sorbifolium]
MISKRKWFSQFLKHSLQNQKINVDVNYHYLLNIVNRGKIKVDYVSSSEMVVDPMTKGLSLEKFKQHITVMGLKNI